MSCSDFLFARPSFLSGYGRVIDINATKNVYNYSGSGEEADYRAIKSDWIMIGNDIKMALEKYAK